MKTKYLLILFSIILLHSCSEDKGNYSYDDIGEVKISGIASRYSRIISERLTIPITLDLQSPVLENNLKYVWEIDGKVVAETKDLDIVVENMSFGDKRCRYTVYDEGGYKMKYYQQFILSVSSPFSWGYYFLTETDDHSSIVSYLPALTEENPRIFYHTPAIGNLPLGKYPVKIIEKFEYVTSLRGWYYTMTFVTSEGDNPCIRTENATFMPNMTINDNSFADQGSGYTFRPSDGALGREEISIYVSNGEVVMHNAGFLYRPARHQERYEWSHPINAITNTLMFVLDKLTNRYFVVAPDKDQNAYDKVIPLEDVPDFNGHTIIGQANTWGYDDEYRRYDFAKVVSVNQSGLHITEMNMSLTHGLNIMENDNPRTTFPELSGIVDANSKAFLMSQIWYLSAGNKIYRSPEELPVFEVLATLPEELGTITEIKPSARQTMLVVSTYNPASSAEKKGSIVCINPLTGEILHTFKNVIDKCVFTFCGNALPLNQTASRGDDL